VGFVVDKTALEHVLSEYWSFPANSHSTDCFTLIIHHPGLVQYQIVADVPSGPSLAPPKETKKEGLPFGEV
jgi:hypothetical protein